MLCGLTVQQALAALGLVFVLTISWQQPAFAETSEENEIIEAACKVEKYLGDDEYKACAEKQRQELRNSTARNAVLALPAIELDSAREKCKGQKHAGVEEYYACIYQESGIEAVEHTSQKEVYKEAPAKSKAEKVKAKSEAAFQWPKWTPLPLTMPANQSGLSKTSADIFHEVSASVYTIIAAPSVEHLKQEEGVVIGSAVAISDSLLLTNCHVVDGNKALVVMQGEYMEAAFLISAKPDYDKCILATSESSLIPLGNIRGYKYLNTGERVYAIGSPNGLQNTISEGIISGLRGTDEISIIQTSAAISHGSSGGGLFDAFGNLIGITTFMLKDGQALNFAIAIDEFFYE